jgi:hypothetical protein
VGQFWLRVALLLLFAVWSQRLVGLDYRTGQMAASFLHSPLLVFHEAGHVIFSPFGKWLMVAGGTLLQLIMPALLCGGLWFTNRDAFGAALGAWFVGVSLLDIAPYVYDALHPRLTLLNGKEGTLDSHDWMFLLTHVGWRDQAQMIGSRVYRVGAAVVVASLLFGAWVLWRQYRAHFRLGRRDRRG